MLNKNGNNLCLVFCDSVKNPVIAPCTSSSFVCNPHLTQMTLEVSGATNIKLLVQGCIKTKDNKGNDLADADCNWYNLASIKMDTFDAANAITDNGLYIINISGLNRIRVKIEKIAGNVTIIGTGER